MAIAARASLLAALLSGCASTAPTGQAQGGLRTVTIAELGDRVITKSKTYRIWGERALQPSEVSDDGEKMTLAWPLDASLPAVFAVDAGGREILPTTMMRSDKLVIDAVYPLLMFKIDNKRAWAKRLPPKQPQ